MDNALVSIIIPSYNYASFIAETLQCLIEQEYVNWEAIVIDDGSTDHTRSVVGDFVKKDDRIKYFFQQNAGLSAARNAGIKLAKGNYFQFLDADDLLSKVKIRSQVEYLTSHPEVAISYTNAFYFKSGNLNVLYKDLLMTDQEWMPKLNGKGYPILKHFIKGNVMPVNSVLIRKQVLDLTGYFNEDLKSLEDWDYWSRCAFKGFNFAHLEQKQAFAMIRIHGESMSTNRTKMFLADVQLRAKFNDEIIASDLSADQKEKLIEENSGIEKYVYIELIKSTGLLNLTALVKLIKFAGAVKFTRYYFKALTRIWKKR